MAKRKSSSPTKRTRALVGPDNRALLRDVVDLIRQAREATAVAVNSALVQLYWRVGTRIRTEVLKEQRAEYAEEICSTLSSQLAAEFGNGFSRQNLNRMIRFKAPTAHPRSNVWLQPREEETQGLVVSMLLFESTIGQSTDNTVDR